MSRETDRLRALALQDQCHAELSALVADAYPLVAHLISRGGIDERVNALRYASDLQLAIVSILASTAMSDTLLRTPAAPQPQEPKE